MSEAAGDNGWLGFLGQKYPHAQSDSVAWVQIHSQRLKLYQKGELVASYPVSTSRYGTGSAEGSERTPLGVHIVKEKFGARAEPGTIFRARMNTGAIADIEYQPMSTQKDFVTSRILWLSGLEPGTNSGAGVDSYTRYIYIHGTHEEGLIGQPASRGCIRMTNADVIELFDRIPKDALVVITN